MYSLLCSAFCVYATALCHHRGDIGVVLPHFQPNWISAHSNPADVPPSKSIRSLTSFYSLFPQLALLALALSRAHHLSQLSPQTGIRHRYLPPHVIAHLKYYQLVVPLWISVNVIYSVAGNCAGIVDTGVDVQMRM